MIKNSKAILLFLLHILKHKNEKSIYSIFYFFKNFIKQREEKKEIFKSIRVIQKDLKGDCDDFVTYIFNRAIKTNYKNIYICFSIKNDYARHVFIIIQNNNGKYILIDKWKTNTMKTSDKIRTLLDYYKNNDYVHVQIYDRLSDNFKSLNYKFGR